MSSAFVSSSRKPPCPDDSRCDPSSSSASCLPPFNFLATKVEGGASDTFSDIYTELTAPITMARDSHDSMQVTSSSSATSSDLLTQFASFSSEDGSPYMSFPASSLISMPTEPLPEEAVANLHALAVPLPPVDAMGGSMHSISNSDPIVIKSEPESSSPPPPRVSSTPPELPTPPAKRSRKDAGSRGSRATGRVSKSSKGGSTAKKQGSSACDDSRTFYSSSSRRGGSSKKKEMTDEELQQCRNQANDRERKRTSDLNNSFARLRKVIPTMPCDKLSKIQTLKLARIYVIFLKERVQSTEINPKLTRKEEIATEFNCWRVKNHQNACSMGTSLSGDEDREAESQLSFGDREAKIEWDEGSLL